MTGIHHHLFGHAASGEQSADTLANPPVATRPDFDDHARTLQPQDGASAGGWSILTRQLQQIGTIEPGGRNTNAHLPDIAGQPLDMAPLRQPSHALQCPHAAPIVPFKKAKSDYRL